MMDLENSRRICLFVHVVMGHGGKFENRIFDLLSENFQTFGTNLQGENEDKCANMDGTRNFLGTQPISSSSVDPSVAKQRNF